MATHRGFSLAFSKPQRPEHCFGYEAEARQGSRVVRLFGTERTKRLTNSWRKRQYLLPNLAAVLE
ncbi:MAG: hypothetical protein U1A28_02710, partial [Patescibacteria group bacterium]|nr:hypothetical protein [Patescibacteria group bacterium]